MLGKQHERAVAFLEEMLRKDIEVDDRSFAVGIGACEAGKKVDKAMQVGQSTAHPPHAQTQHRTENEGKVGLLMLKGGLSELMRLFDW